MSTQRHGHPLPPLDTAVNDTAFLTGGLPLDSPTAPLRPDVVDLRRRHRTVLAGGLAAGIIGDRLIDVNALTPAPYLLALVIALVIVIRDRRGALPLQSAMLLGAAAFFSVVTALRDAPVLMFFATAGALALAAVAASPATVREDFRLQDTRLSELFGVTVHSALFAALGPVRIGGRASEPVSSHTSTPSLVVSIGRSLLLATIAVLSIGMLLAEGDPVFANATSALRQLDLGLAVFHTAVAVFFAWPVMGLLMGASGVSALSFAPPMPALPVLNRLDIVSVLGALSLLFGVFVLLQVRVLFGGAAYVASATGLSMAEYARDGFFTLVFVAAVTIGLLLALDALFGRDTLAGWAPARRLSQLLLALVGVVMASAAVRMVLYIDAFGLSVDRIVAFTAIIWLAMVCGWLSLTVLASRARQFVIGTAVAGCTCVGALMLASPDRLVVQDVIDRAERGAVVDLPYVVNDLSADAVPLFVSAIADGTLAPGMYTTGAADASCLPIAGLLDRWDTDTDIGWNIARLRARAAVREHHALIESVMCPREQRTTR